ncbi:MAG: hypothetical protein ACYCY6_01930 [Minisyncoccota bacterium]
MVKISKIDFKLIKFFNWIFEPLARVGIFVIYFWFGLLKVVDASPASPLVQELFEKTVGFMPFSTFIVLFGLFEMLIGVLFVIKGFERVVMPLLLIHMITTFMPLIMVPAATWSGFFIPTMEGQYIIKNLVLIATAVGISAHLKPMKRG